MHVILALFAVTEFALGITRVSFLTTNLSSKHSRGRLDSHSLTAPISRSEPLFILLLVLKELVLLLQSQFSLYFVLCLEAKTEAGPPLAPAYASLFLPSADDEGDTESPYCLLQSLYCRYVMCPVDVYVGATHNAICTLVEILSLKILNERS